MEYFYMPQMIHMLSTAIIRLIDNVDSVSLGVLDTLFFYLINPQQSNWRESYYMARSIIQATHAQLDAPIENVCFYLCIIFKFVATHSIPTNWWSSK